MSMCKINNGAQLLANSDGLPCAFLHSMWTLFHILDDGRRGAVHLSEIESRWRGADARELPPGVLECLRRAAPASGYLTFDHFVAGLQIAVFGEETGKMSPIGLGKETRVAGKMRCAAASLASQVPEKPAAGYQGVQDWRKRSRYAGVENAGRRRQSVEAGQYRTEAGRIARHYPPLEPQGPQEEISLVGGEGRRMLRSQSESTTCGKADSQQLNHLWEEHRRHTIPNGVDYSMLKRMKELEQEKDFLLQGLEMVDCTRDWYHRQIQTIKEKQKLIGKNTANNDYFSEGSPSRLSHLLPKLQEVNRCLADLIFFTGKPSGLSMPALNGLSHPPPSVLANQQAINMLKDQNRLLTKEVTDKSERITQLEQEKSALIKQLFEARAQSNHENSQLDSTFI
ncbi:suppressor APC domain-containing protein 2 [Latimeria chalumnae]|uniref:suppressor APC domain-containing protein 2 n=1 Tax=Latimeria chalumnae TaxID=7897 RepID=UPI00313EC6AA